MLKVILPLLLLLTATAFTANHGATAKWVQQDTTPANTQMKEYWLVFLYKGFNRKQDSTTAATLQDGHMANIKRLAKEGVLIMAGPMGDDNDLRGIFILDAKDSATAAGYVNTDPAIIAGRLRFEIRSWWTQKGTYTFK